MWTQESLDQIFSCRAIFFRIPASVQLARQDTPAECCISERAGHENFVARPRCISPHHTASNLAEERDSDRQLTRARNIAANYIGRGFPRRIAQPRVNSLERPRCNSSTHG